MAPVTVLCHSSMHHICKHLAQSDRGRPELPGSDLAEIDTRDGADLNSGSGEEHLVGKIDLGSINRTLDNLHVQFLAHELNDGPASNSLKDVIGDRRRCPFPVAIQENVCSRTFRNVSVL